MESPYKNASDSPSRQLLWELGRLSVTEQKSLYDRLDLDAEERENLHHEELQRAAAAHARVRQEAELAQQQLEARAALERERKAQRDLLELEALRRQRKEQDAKFEKEKEKEEAAIKRAAERRKQEAAAAAERELYERQQAELAARQRVADEEDRKQKAAEAEAKAKEAAIAAKKRQEAAKVSPAPVAPSQQASATAPAAAVNGIASTELRRAEEDVEKEHQRYFEIWRRLKELRTFVKDHAKTNPEFKKLMGDGRRLIRKCVGQLVTDSQNPSANKQPNMEIRNVIRSSHNFPTPTLPLNHFIANPPPDLAQSQIPVLFLYLLHIFAKCLVSQFLGEVAIAPNTATTIGITGATIFAQDDCRWQGLSLIDLFVAKYHQVCPVIFGIYGDETSTRGKRRLGWWYADDTKTSFCTEQRHYERMTGLGAGFAAMTLRAYKNRSSPYPAWHFWQALARIMNVPKEKVTSTHLVVLKSMIEGNEGRILEFFGRAGLVVLRVALKEFPASLPLKDGVAARSLLLIPDVLATEKKLHL